MRAQMYLQPMQSLIAEREISSFTIGNELPADKNYIWLLIKGVVKTYTQGQGRSITLGFWGSKDVVGRSLSSINPYRTKCLTDVKAIAVPRTQWKSLSREMIYCEQQMQQLIYIVRNNRVANKVWLLLTWLASKFGREVPKGVLIDFKLTHQELADSLGTTRITVTKVLNQFEREGLVFRPKTKCIIIRK